MLGLRLPTRSVARDEAEKPFWISFSDLMTALMVLFLVAMAVALVAVTQSVRKIASLEEQRKAEIEVCMSDVTAITMLFPGVTVQGYSIDFGTHALFATNSHMLGDKAGITLRNFVPRVLEVAKHPSCDKWFKRVIVEGFASRSGTYMHNLNLSLQRAERVLCVLLDSSEKAINPLSEADRKAVRALFLVGGSSFNALKENDFDSQRVELKLEFLNPGESRAASRDVSLDSGFFCPIDKT